MQHKRTTKPFSDVQVNEDLKRRKKLGSFLVYGEDSLWQTCTGKGFSCGDIS